MSKFKKGDRVQILGKSTCRISSGSTERELERWGHKLYSIAVISTVRNYDNPNESCIAYFLDNKDGRFVAADLKGAMIEIL